ncbi:hypothetical protein Daus18300_010390 [Diaporthe australafricana]|uniref:Uncharacterized protein n=1 Tax=Diaporthe australafricana TaxID=127596 RepID=A0ABR3WAD4_9PEZI
MLAHGKSVLAALLLAYCAMTAPVPAGEYSYVRQVTKAIRANLWETVAGPSPKLMVILKDTENALASNGTIHGKTLDRLDHNIEILHKQYHLSIEEISEHVADALSPGWPKAKEGKTANGTTVLDHGAVKGVLARGLELKRQDVECPGCKKNDLACCFPGIFRPVPPKVV